MEKRFVYADNSSTTKVMPEVYEVMKPFFGETYGNPSSLHIKGREADKTINEARAKIASILNCKPNEIFFTSGGTESNNWAIKGAARANKSKGNHIITTSIEHPSVLNTMKSLEKEGFEVTYLELDNEGLLAASDVEKAIRPDTILVAIMYANNEIGTILPIKEIAKVTQAKKVTFFTDAVQAVGSIPIDLPTLGVDMLSLSGHKIHTPKGIGALYVKTGTRIHNLIDGGGQERGRRGGTENIAYIAALAKALEITVSRLDSVDRIRAMRDKLTDALLEIPYSRLNGSKEHRLSGNVNISFEFIEGEGLLLWLDIHGICASTGSACSSKSLDPSHVLLAIGVPVEIAHGSLRLSLTHENTDEDVDYIIETVPKIVQKLRDMSPLYEDVIKGKSKSIIPN